jgi:hypothetical protein
MATGRSNATLIGSIIAALLFAEAAARAENSWSDIVYVLESGIFPAPDNLGAKTRDQWCQAARIVINSLYAKASDRLAYERIQRQNECLAHSGAQSQQNWCNGVYGLLGNPFVDPFQKQALLEKARNRGCLQ